MARYAVGLLLLAAAGGIAWMLWPRSAPPLQQSGGKPGAAGPDPWSPGRVLAGAVEALSGDRTAGSRTHDAIQSATDRAMAAVDRTRRQAGRDFAGWLAGMLG